ncbi:hypothetical protein THAOC_12843, partial [Thalassiosira oceanica]
LPVRIKEFMLNNQAHFSVELLRTELQQDMFPALVDECKKSDGYEQDEGYVLAQHYIDKPPSYSTVLRWVHRMGLSYKTQSKSYMVDGHENEEQRAHRDQHTRFYLAELELKTHRWIQLTEDEYAKLSFQVLAKPVEYTDDVTGKKMFQFHVDDHEELQALANKKYGEFGGNVHYTWKGKPVIIFGQDESTFNQYAFGNKLWVGSNGRACLPAQAQRNGSHDICFSREEGALTRVAICWKGGMKDSGKPLDITHHMIEKMKKVVSSHRAALDHDRGYLDKIIKEECFDLVRFVVKSESKSLPVKREESSGETSRKSSRKRTKTSRG